MKRRENVKKRISVLTLAGMLAVSACPLSASAENIPDSAAGAEEVQASSAEDVPEDSGSLWKEETGSAAGQDTEKDSSGNEAEVTEQDGQGGAEEPENEAGGVLAMQKNPIQTNEEEGREQEDSGRNGQESGEGGQQSSDTGDAEPSDTAFFQTDPDTGICAEAAAGVFPAGTLMIVTPLTEGENYDLLRKLLSAAADQFQVCDISFFSVSMPDFSDMKPVQPQGKVKIQMPVPRGYDLSWLAVYHITTDGGMTEVPFVLQDGSAVFETDQFSLYALVEQKETRTDLPSSLEMTDKISRLDLNRTHSGGSGSGAGDGSGASGRTGAGAGFSGYVSPRTGDRLNEKDLRSRIFLMATALLVSAGTAAAGGKRKKAADGAGDREN